MTTLKDIVALKGKGGLFAVLKEGNGRFILESLDSSKKKIIVHNIRNVSSLESIGIYTHGKQDTVSLRQVLQHIQHTKGEKWVAEETDSPDELRNFIKTFVPNYDEKRVYLSDIKKLIKWYNILQKHAPKILEYYNEEKEEN